MEGIANMPRVSKEFEDIVLTNDGILEVVFGTGVGKYLAALWPGMSNLRSRFYAEYANASPVGQDNVKLTPWSEVTSARIATEIVGQGRNASPKTIFYLAAAGELDEIPIDPNIVNGLAQMLADKLGERFENQYNPDVYTAFKRPF